MTDETSPIDIRAIAKTLNAQAVGHAIGNIQDIRARLKAHRRRAGSTIFSGQTIFPKFAYHHGGRKELQFNIGTEFAEDGSPLLRHGVAFSLEPSRGLPDIKLLFPSIRLFNTYMKLYPSLLTDMTMWHERGGAVSGEYPPGPIPPDLLASGVFVMLGKVQSALDLDLELILVDFDRLLPLFEYVESRGQVEPVAAPVAPFRFTPGLAERKRSAVMSRTPSEVDMDLRHIRIQGALYARLVGQYGKDNVSAEQPSGSGTFVDVALRRARGTYWFYEIKTAYSSRACIREAIGQLLEYAYWPGSPVVERLIVVGEAPLDPSGSAYLDRLRQRFSLPLDYQQLALTAGIA